MLIQEHKLKASDAPSHRQKALYQNLVPLISYTRDANGGAAILLPLESIELRKGENARDARERVMAAFQAQAGGAVASTTVKLAGLTTKLVSMYAPVENNKRVAFFNRHLNDTVDSSTLLGMDANCVPNAITD